MPPPPSPSSWEMALSMKVSGQIDQQLFKLPPLLNHVKFKLKIIHIISDALSFD